MQVKLINIINELGINKPNPTAQEVHQYYNDYILNNYYAIIDDEIDVMWGEFAVLRENIFQVKNVGLKTLGKADQMKLNLFMKEMKQLMQKHAPNNI